MKLSPTIVNEIIFLALIGILGYFFIILFTPFLPIIFIGLIIVIFFHPIYKLILKTVKNTVLSSILTSIIAIVSILIPISIVFTIAANQASVVADEIITSVLTNATEEQQAEIRENVYDLLEKIGITIPGRTEDQGSPIDLSAIISNSQLLQNIKDIIPIVISTLSLITDFIFKGFILIFIIIFLFIEFDRLPENLARYSPLENKIDELLFTKFVKSIKAIIKGSFLVAVIQATTIIIPMLLFGIPGTAIWWIIMFILSIVPVGAGAVSIPIGLVMIISPDYEPILGIFLILYSIISINIIDNLIRPQLTKSGTGLHPLVILLSGIGGIIVFSSPLGLIYGQLIAVFYKTVIQVYQEKYNSQIANESK